MPTTDSPVTRGARGSRVTESAITTPEGFSGPVVVRFGEEYVWSYHPDRDAARTPEGRVMPWPAPVRPLLLGTTRVRLADPAGEQVLLDEVMVFGGSDQPLALRDARGHRVAVDKWGKLTRVFAETGGGLLAELVAGTVKAIEDLREHAGVEAHLNYGGLLGAVRDGHFIGHDNDADLAYLSERTHPVEIALESYRVERAMRALGWKVVRLSAADLKLYYPLSDGTEAHVDVFGAFYVGGVFYLLGDTSGELDEGVVLPLSTVTLEGVEVAAPARPEQMLEFLYGPDWRVPDPAFSRTWPGEGRHRLDGWLRGTRNHIKEWNALLKAAPMPWRRSSFCDWALDRIPSPADAEHLVVDLGCGSGRDAQRFAMLGHEVAAYDFAGTALRKTRRRLARHTATPRVGVLSLDDFRSIALTGAELARHPGPVHVYARHLVDAIDDDGLANLLRLVSMALRHGGSVSLEFSAIGAVPSLGPAPLPPVAMTDTSPYYAPAMVHRVDPERVAAGLRDLGLEVVDLEVGPGTDVAESPDACVARLHARKPEPQETP